MDNFKECLGFAVSGETVRRNMQIILRHFKVKDFKNLEFEEGRDEYDLEIVGEGIKKIEFKNYKEYIWSSNICLEHNSSSKYRNEGWTEKLVSDYILFTWHGKNKECYLILHAQMLKDWWIKNKNNYFKALNAPEERFGYIDRSVYSFVPVKDLPSEMIVARKVFTDLNDFWNNK